MDSDFMIKYVDYFNDKRMKNRSQKNLIMLVYNSFKDHLEESIKRKFHECSFDLAVILSGLTSIYQPLDVTINKPFRDHNGILGWLVVVLNKLLREIFITLDLMMYVCGLKGLGKG